VSRVIWLDCDMLVQADLGELWDRPFMGSVVMAVQDSLVPFVSSRFGVSGYDELGIAAGAPYFNAGMMVIDLAAWRAADISKRALDHLRKLGHRVFFWDQEALNAVLAGKWQQLEPRWNWSANLDRLSAASAGGEDKPARARIVHFNGNIKPWRVNAGGNLDSAYFRVVDETSWSGWRPGKSPRSSLLAWYGSSRLRKRVYPAEHLAVQLLRRFTQRIT
jgi:lipopolysaccharide biosynthesis glycosyltransferase